ncbi:MAG: AbrB/MazE/SpoVT family DNA-binding domain-containing protein [Chloroflexota bacterium]|jgi:AbrB family looped-hinge helix DNA binding protein
MNDEQSTYNISSNPVRLRERGQLTIPQSVRDRSGLTDGDILTLFQLGDLIVLSPREPQVPILADKIVKMMEKEGVSLVDLLSGL